MRPIKMLGLAMALAVTASVFAIVGPSTAGATQLCGAHPEGKECEESIAPNDLIDIDALQLGTARLLGTLGEIHCKGGHVKGQIDAGPAEGSLLGTLTQFTYLECQSLLAGCNGKPVSAVTTVNSQIHLAYTEAGLGELTIVKPATEVTIVCGGIIGTIKCKFAENDTVKGIVHNLYESKVLPVALFSKAPITGPGGGLCPTSGELDATFELSYLDTSGAELPVFVATGAEPGTTQLCGAHPEGKECEESIAPNDLIDIDALQLGSWVILTSLGQIHCKGGHVNGEVEIGPNPSSLLGKIRELTYLECQALLVGCNGKPATVTTTVKPQIHLSFTEKDLGDLTIVKPATTATVACGGIVGTKICKFAENDTVLGTFHNLIGGVALPQLQISKALITGPLNAGVCPKHGELDATYDLKYLDGTTEKPVFIAA